MNSNDTKDKTPSPTRQAFFDAIRNHCADEVREWVASDSSLLLAYDENEFDATPLTLAVCQNDRTMIDVLIELKCDLDRPSNWWAGPWTPLHCAIHNGNDELANYLLERGATLDVHTAAGLGRIDDLHRLLNEAPERVIERGGDGCHPLHFAGSIEAAEFLLEQGADIEARDIDHQSTPVQYLACSRPNVARYLLENGAEPDIFSAVLADDAITVRSLISENPEVVNERIGPTRFPPGPKHPAHNILTFNVGSNCTPLHAAAKCNRASMVDVLVEGGAKVDARGGYDDATPLHLAAWENHPEVVRRLVACGADINIRSGRIHNNSPAGWSIVAGSDQVFVYLMDQGAERLDWFAADAAAALAGDFLKFKTVPRSNYERIAKRLATN